MITSDIVYVMHTFTGDNYFVCVAGIPSTIMTSNHVVYISSKTIGASAWERTEPFLELLLLQS